MREISTLEFLRAHEHRESQPRPPTPPASSRSKPPAAMAPVAVGTERAAPRNACTLPPGNRHATELMPAIRDLTAQHGWRPEQIDELYLSLGPGSFTGLRIAVAIARALQQAIGCRLVGVPTLDVIAANAPTSFAIVVPILDAKPQPGLFRALPAQPRRPVAPDRTRARRPRRLPRRFRNPRQAHRRARRGRRLPPGRHRKRRGGVSGHSGDRKRALAAHCQNRLSPRSEAGRWRSVRGSGHPAADLHPAGGGGRGLAEEARVGGVKGAGCQDVDCQGGGGVGNLLLSPYGMVVYRAFLAMIASCSCHHVVSNSNQALWWNRRSVVDC